MIWIKICGTTNLEDALTSVEAGADALGFVFYEKSPRKIDPDKVREIVKELPPGIERVGVFVHESFEQSREIAAYCGLTAVQLCESRERAISVHSKAGCKLFVAVPASVLLDDPARFSTRQEGREFIDALFVDSGSREQPGGTGVPFHWQQAAPAIGAAGRCFNMVIAGGLDDENVTQAIRILNPWGVDVVSGVEASPGKKDPHKVRAFIAAVREFEKLEFEKLEFEKNEKKKSRS
jgi:phosphoribosylanthranilate isomerase